MWDRPDALNALAGVLCAAALLLAAYGSVHYVVRLPLFPLREVSIEGDLAHVTREQLETLARRELRGNFFTLDLGEARTAFAALPWVRKVAVRRQWPDRLEVALEEHVPLARWGGTALVDTHGDVFTAAYDGAPIPNFIGPPQSAKEIAIQYSYFLRRLATIGQVPVEVQVSPRRAWQVRLASGLTLRLGRERIEARLDRYIALHARTLGRLQRKLDYVDLRYPSGFAVRIPELKTEPQQPRRGGKAARGLTPAKGNG